MISGLVLKYLNGECFVIRRGYETSPARLKLVLSDSTARTSEGLQRISAANIKHGRQTKDKLAAQRHAAKVGRRVLGELKRLERQLEDAGLMPDGD